MARTTMTTVSPVARATNTTVSPVAAATRTTLPPFSASHPASSIALLGSGVEDESGNAAPERAEQRQRFLG